MYVFKETLEFFQFIGVGVILAFIFDFFRAYRRYKKVNSKVVFMQDIIYFLIAWIILIISILKLLDGNIRLYLILGILLGILLYISALSSYTIKLFIYIFKVIHKFIDYILLPIELIKQVFEKISTFLVKIIKKCCKMFINMILNIYNFTKKIILRPKFKGILKKIKPNFKFLKIKLKKQKR